MSPYGISKLYSYWLIKNYREAYNIYACNGILFNHESPRRAYNFVTRKITLGLSKILKGETNCLILGNLDAQRDWGFAGDYIKAMYLMLQQEKAEDFVIATGEMHSVRQFVEIAFLSRGINISWKGKRNTEDEIGYNTKTEEELIFIDKKYFRLTEVDELCGDATKAKKILNWEPETSFDQLVQMMVNHDCPCI